MSIASPSATNRMPRLRGRLAVALVAATSLTACSNGALNDNQNAVAGTGIGAAVGGLLGRIVSDDKRKGTRVGAILGAGVGAAVGSNIDRQEAALRQQMAGSGAMIQRQGDQLMVTLPESITFDLNSSAVKPRFVSDLGALAANLNDFPATRVTIVGHTDNTGSVPFNQRLSEDRARAVAGVLMANGVASNRIVTMGDGEFSPVASNATAAGREANRRVVVTITPL